MIKKMGLDPSDPEERKQAGEILAGKGLYDPDTKSSWP
jgi:hypothetical protein